MQIRFFGLKKNKTKRNKTKQKNLVFLFAQSFQFVGNQGKCSSQDNLRRADEWGEEEGGAPVGGGKHFVSAKHIIGGV